MGLLLFAIMNPLVIITLLEINPPPSLLTPFLSPKSHLQARAPHGLSYYTLKITTPTYLYRLILSKPLYDYDSMTQFSTAQFITEHPFSPSSSSPSSPLLLQKPTQDHKKMCLTSHKIYFSMQHKQSKRCRIQVHRLAR